MDVKQFTTPSNMNADEFRELIERYRVQNPRKYALKKEGFEKKLAEMEGRPWPPVVEKVEEVQEEVKEVKPTKAKKVVDNEKGK